MNKQEAARKIDEGKLQTRDYLLDIYDKLEILEFNQTVLAKALKELRNMLKNEGKKL